MPLASRLRTLVALVVIGSAGAAAAVTDLASPVAALPAAEPARAGSVGADGIGDPYFPLDGNGGIDVRRYDVRVRYDFATGRLQGRTRLVVRATQRLSRFNLDLLLPVSAVEVDGRPARFTKPDRHELQVTPRRDLRAGEVVDVVVTYAGRPAAATYAGERNWLADGAEVVTMNEPHMAPWWFPANDHPEDKAKVDIRVTVPRATEVVANGRRVGRTVSGDLATTHWRADEPMAPYLAFFAAGDFETALGRFDGRPWFVAVSERLGDVDQRRAMRLMKQTPRIVAWTERQLGRYPFSATGGVTTSLDVGFALENQTRPTYPALAGDGTLLVVHEIAHQWFGNSVSLARWRDIWLNEGAATYLEQRWVETHGGPSAQAWLEETYERLREYDDFWQLRIDDPGPRHLFDSAVYVRGAMTLQALRHRIGNAAFSRLLRTWVADRRGGHGTTARFVALAEQVSGEQLDAFFQVWLRDSRPPAHTRRNGF